MLKSLILYFLEAKPAHGYEIQKYISLNQIDQWTKIHSGSIYYAFSKLEKDGLIALDSEEEAEGRMRKVYHITNQGRRALRSYLKDELNRQMQDPGADKFLLNPLIGLVDRAESEKILKEHISYLKQKRSTVEGWKIQKVGPHTSRLERLSIMMMISNLDQQIEWHQALLEDLDECNQASIQLRELIRSVNFSTLEHLPKTSENIQQEVDALRKAILSKPENAAENLNRLINLIEKRK